MCILPLAVSYLVTFVYDAGYQLFSAFGVATYVINSPQQKVGGLMLMLHANIVPLILLYYIPFLNGWLVSIFVKRAPKKTVMTVKELHALPDVEEAPADQTVFAVVK